MAKFLTHGLLAMSMFPTDREDATDVSDSTRLAGIERALELQLETDLKYDVSTLCLAMEQDGESPRAR